MEQEYQLRLHDRFSDRLFRHYHGMLFKPAITTNLVWKQRCIDRLRQRFRLSKNSPEDARRQLHHGLQKCRSAGEARNRRKSQVRLVFSLFFSQHKFTIKYCFQSRVDSGRSTIPSTPDEAKCDHCRCRYASRSQRDAAQGARQSGPRKDYAHGRSHK